MQRDEKVYDMYKRRVESNLSYGHGAYSGGVPSGGRMDYMDGEYMGGVPSGGKYCTGDGLKRFPKGYKPDKKDHLIDELQTKLRDIQGEACDYNVGSGFSQSPMNMYMTRRYENPPPYYQGNGRNCYTDYRHANKGVKKADMKPYTDYVCPPKHYVRPPKKYKPRKPLSAQAKNKMKKGANEFLRFYRRHADSGWSRHDILCAWHSERPAGARKIRKLMSNNCQRRIEL